MHLTLGFSTCPNDTYMFDAMVNGRIDTEGFTFDSTLADIEKLNNYAIQGELDIVKISYAFYPKVSNTYQILNAGSALGHGNGPIIVSKNPINTSEINNLHIAIPGFNTTANFLLSIAFPNVRNKTEFVFSEIEDAILNDKVDAGLLIHEGRFTYEKKGLKMILDMGAWWEQNTKLAIPLGGIMIKRTLPEATKITVNRVLKNSISFAFQNPTDSLNFIKTHAQDMDNEIINQHIKLYVNEYSLDLGTKGRKAIEYMFKEAMGIHKINTLTQPIFAI